MQTRGQSKISPAWPTGTGPGSNTSLTGILLTQLMGCVRELMKYSSFITTDFTPLSTRNILDISVEWSEIPEELFVSIEKLINHCVV